MPPLCKCTVSHAARQWMKYMWCSERNRRTCIANDAAGATRELSSSRCITYVPLDVSFKTHVSFEQKLYKRDLYAAKRLIFLSILLMEASAYATRMTIHIAACNMYSNCCRRCSTSCSWAERWGAGVETQKNVRGVFGGWGRVPFDEPYAPLLSTIHDGA